MLLSIIIASLAVSLVAFIGLFVVFKKKNLADSQLNYLVSLAIGTLLGAVFLHLLPELAEQEIINFSTASIIILGSIVSFFILETILHWHHCRHDECHDHKDKKQLIYMNLIGDGIHNFVDGALIASSFLVDFKLGIIVTLAVIVHEIPQELSDFGVLLYAGLTKARALFYNFISACVAILGAILAYTFAQTMELITPVLLAIAAGNFIYLAAADLIPEIHHQREAKRLFQSVITIIFGILVVVILNTFLAVE
jgi:zinc and cadmium transporter